MNDKITTGVAGKAQNQVPNLYLQQVVSVDTASVHQMSLVDERRKSILYIASSLDGYISKPGDNLDFLSYVEKEGEDYGYSEFIKTVDTVVLGRKTYDWVVAHAPDFVHADKKTYVVTRTPRPDAGNTVFHTGNPEELVAELQKAKGKHIFIDGGAELVHALLKARLIDEIVLSIIPVLLGEGVRLFKDQRPEQSLKLIDSKHFDTGLVQIHYSCH